MSDAPADDLFALFHLKRPVRKEAYFCDRLNSSWLLKGTKDDTLIDSFLVTQRHIYD